MANTYTKDEKDKKLPAESTNVATPKVNGVDDNVLKTANSSFSQSDETTKKQQKSDNALGNYENIVSNDNIISKDTWNAINSKFVKPTAVTEADSYIKTQLSKIQSGKTSYSDQVRDMISQIQNREKFSYDVDSDPLFQQALASAMNSGKSAMQDTIGQASALTGGYGSSYATSAANQAYNAYIEDAYNNLPQYYNMALEAYQMEGEDMYNQLAMLNDADATEYSRLLSAYDATYQHRNQMYNEAYTQFRDMKSDAFGTANLQLSEYSQKANDAYNLYTAYANEANTSYQRDYTSWADTVNQAMQTANMQNNDYWKNEDLKEKQRQYDTTMTFNKDQADKEWGYKYATLDEEKRQYNITHGDTDGDGKLSAEEIAAYNAKQGKDDEEETKKIESEIPSGIKTKVSNIKTNGELEEYLDKQVVQGTITEEQADYLYSTHMTPEQSALNERTWTMVDNGGNNWFDGIDGNGIVRDQYGTEYRLDDLYKELKRTMSADDAKAYIKKLQKELGITKK